LFEKVNNILTHTKQFAFHSSDAGKVYIVGYDLFTFTRPSLPVRQARSRPEC
jgi:hypothetical protein